MKEIDFGNYSFVNYTDLPYDLVKLVLDERNKEGVSKWMNTNKPIRLADHLRFVETLKYCEDKKYWLVFKLKKPIGAVYVTDLDWDLKKGVWGYFLFEQYHGTGWAIDVEFYALSVFFNILKLNKVFGFVESRNINSLSLQPLFNFKNCGVYKDQIAFILTKDDYDLLPKKMIDFKLIKILGNGNT